ncbi:MAG: TIR domain-containing protein, partial [Methylocystis sp.]|nr:TIR domain-containing protein [Methylocystis sp.]
MDAFLSYNRADAAAVNTLDTWLASHGLRCFLDTRELSSGGAWLPELERAITREASAMLVLVGPAGLGNTQHYEYQLGLTRQAAEPAFPLIPVLLPGTPEYRFPRGFLGLQTWVNFAEGLNDPAAQQRLLAAIRRERLDAEAVRGAICPYKGLEAFQEEDGKIFFGRDVEAAQLHRTVIEHGVAAVIGRSGSGKSSLARAGLLPRLRQKSEGHWGVVWDRLVLRPGRYPLSALAEALDPPQAPPGSVEYGAALRRTADLLRGQQPDFVPELLHRRLAALDRRTDRFLILLDQAEEMFARPIELTDAQAIRDWQADTETLIALLLGAAQRGPASLVLTIRSDFFDPLQHSPMGPLLNKAMVATRGVQDLRAAVAGPAGLVGLRFSPGLEDRILRETGTDEGNLPLLQHALTRSWAWREGGVITSAAYDRSGGVEQAINLAAQTAFDALGSEGQAAAKRLFLRLVRPGEGRGHVRVRALLPEEGAQRVVAEFFGAPERRLLFFGQLDGRNTVEVSHEALIRGWPTLLEWVEENRERLATRDAVLDWIAGSGGELLPAGALLARASALLAAPGDVALEDIAPLIRASEAAAARALEERAAQAAREARLAADRAEAAERLVRRTRLAAAGLGVLAFIALGSGLYAWVQRGAAERSATVAEQRRGEAEAAAARAEAARQTAEAEQARAEREEAAAAEARREALRQAQSAQTSAALAEQRRAEAEAETQRAEREAEAAEAARARAETGFAAARDTASSLVFDLAQGLRNREGMPTALVRDMLDRAGRALDALLARTPDDPATLRLRGAAYTEFATTFATLGDTARQREAAQQAVGIFGRLAERDPGNTQWQRDLSVSHERIGTVLEAQGDLPGALRAYQAVMAIATRLAERDPGNTEWQRDLSISHQRIGSVLRAQGDLPGALRAYQASLAIRTNLAERDPGNAQWQRDLSLSHDRIGDVLEAQGDRPGALRAYQARMAIATRLAERDPGNTEWQRDLSISHQRIGSVLRAQGDLPGALRAYQAGMAIATRLAERDPGNAEWQRDLSLSHTRIGDVLVAQGDRSNALGAYQAGMAIATRLAERDPGNAEWQRDLSVSHDRIGDVLRAQGDRPGALRAYQAGMAIRMSLAERDPSNTLWQRDLSVSHNQIGDVLGVQE